MKILYDTFMFLDGIKYGTGYGTSKKQAKNEAAVAIRRRGRRGDKMQQPRGKQKKNQKQPKFDVFAF